jgi:ABC-type Na+ efflux pump permease subunit
MIDPVTIGLAVAGVKAVVTGVKEAAALAREAFDEINGAVESGKTLADSMSGVTKFFSAAGKYEHQRTQLEEAKAAQEAAVAKGEPVPDYVSDAEYVMELMIIDRQIKQYYDDIKHIFTYHFQEAGMWDEFWQRMGKLRAEREAKAEAARQAETEKRLHEKTLVMKKRRKRQELIDNVEMVGAGIVIVIIILMFFWAMWWMFQQGG